MGSLTVDLPTDIERRLAALAATSGRNESDIIREAIEWYLLDATQPLPRSMGIISDPTLSGADSEDWLLEHMGKILEHKINRASTSDLRESPTSDPAIPLPRHPD